MSFVLLEFKVEGLGCRAEGSGYVFKPDAGLEQQVGDIANHVGGGPRREETEQLRSLGLVDELLDRHA